MKLTRWDRETLPSRDVLRSALTGEGLTVSEWVDPPGMVYPVHQHDNLEVRWVIHGKMRVGLPESGEEFTLDAGDRLDIPSNTPHWTDVDGESPVIYLWATNSPSNSKK